MLDLVGAPSSRSLSAAEYAARDRRRLRLLVLLTVLACLNAWFEPFEGGRDDESAVYVSTPPDPLVRETPGWTPFKRATLTPGIQTLTAGAGQCTTNFVFTDAAGEVYLGQAAHCAGLTEEMNGCVARTRRLGTKVTFAVDASGSDLGRTLGRGTLVYSSWRTMQERGETDPVRCAYNDFALIRVPRRLHDRVNPTLPYWGGPEGLRRTEVWTVDRVYGYGRSSMRKVGSTASRQSGTTTPDSEESRGWSHHFSARSPGIPGDSGSGYVDRQGLAVGTLSTLSIGPIMWNGLGDLTKQLKYARRHSGIRGLRLELGTKPFNRLRADQSR